MCKDMCITNLKYTMKGIPMSFYCGTDIVEVSRIKNAIEKNDKFKSSICTTFEIDDIEKASNEDFKFQRYAGRFASKEAIYKALSKIFISERFSPSFLDVEIINDDNYRRRPYVKVINEDLQKIFYKYKIEIDLSISHIKENATAMVVAYVEKE